MDTNLIHWPKAVYWTKQWNPWIGCHPVSPACEHCYAAAIARRFKLSFTPHRTHQKLPRTGIVFCGNMTDCFGDWVPYEDRLKIIQKGLSCEKSVNLWLTKRVRNMCDALTGIVHDDCWFAKIKNNPRQFFGFTAEDQYQFDMRWLEWKGWAPKNLNVWISVEPLLGPIRLRYLGDHEEDWPKWVVVGCESGPQRRPCKLDWIEDIVSQCQKRHVLVFVKQLDLNGKCVTDINQFPAHLRIRQVPWSYKENT